MYGFGDVASDRTSSNHVEPVFALFVSSIPLKVTKSA